MRHDFPLPLGLSSGPLPSKMGCAYPEGWQAERQSEVMAAWEADMQGSLRVKDLARPSRLEA